MSTIKRTGGNVSVSLSVFVYKDLNYPDGDMYIAYCPELDLAGYDTTNRKARKSFEYVLKDYLDHTIQNGTLEEDLIGHGWRKYKNGRIAEPTYSELLKRSQLKSILNQRTFNKYSIPVLGRSDSPHNTSDAYRPCPRAYRQKQSSYPWSFSQGI